MILLFDVNSLPPSIFFISQPIFHRHLLFRSPVVCFFYPAFLAVSLVRVLLFPVPLFPPHPLSQPSFLRSLFISREWSINHIKAREIYFPDI